MTKKDPNGQDGRSSGVRVTAEACLRLQDRDACEQAKAALAPESEGFLTMEVNEDGLRIQIPSGSTGRVLSTLDDALSCLQAALGSKAAARTSKPQEPKTKPQEQKTEGDGKRTQ